LESWTLSPFPFRPCCFGSSFGVYVVFEGVVLEGVFWDWFCRGFLMFGFVY